MIYKHSDRGMKMTRTVRMHLSGEVCVEGQEEIAARVAEIRDAYADDYKDCILYMDSGAPTAHQLINNHADNMTGVKVVYRSWPKGDPAEFATVRTFYIILEATFRDLESEILSFQDTLRFVSTGGSAYTWTNMPYGPPQIQRVHQYTTQKIIQCGQCVGYDGYPLVRIPAPVFPAYEHLYRRQMDLIGPQYNGRQFSHYGVKWCYFMEAPSGQTAIPNAY